MSIVTDDWVHRVVMVTRSFEAAHPSDYVRVRKELEAFAAMLASNDLHQHLLDMLGAKDHADAARIIAELHARELSVPNPRDTFLTHITANQAQMLLESFGGGADLMELHRMPRGAVIDDDDAPMPEGLYVISTNAFEEGYAYLGDEDEDAVEAYGDDEAQGEAVGYANSHELRASNDGFVVMRKPNSDFFNVPIFAAPPAAQAVPDGMCIVTKEDGNNYCRILRALGMEDEGDPVAEVERLAASAAIRLSPLIARSLAEWHEDDGTVIWFAWCGHEWAGEPAWIGTPNGSGWPGYHTHWVPHTAFPEAPAAKGKDDE